MILWPKKMLPVAVLGEIHDILFPIPDPSSQTHSNILSQITGRTGALRGAGRPFLHVSPTLTPSPPATPCSPVKSSTTNKNVIKMKKTSEFNSVICGYDCSEQCKHRMLKG